MSVSRFDPGCCCCPTIGFDESAWPFTTCCTGISPLINLASDVSRLGECSAVFGGNLDACGHAIRFASSDWPAVKSYIEGGGRLWINAENSACMALTSGSVTRLNDFLAAIGSTLTYGNHDYNNSSPNCFAEYYVPGSANIAQGINFTGARFSDIGGGTSVWIGTTGSGSGGDGAGQVAVAIEKLGNGFFLLCGDSNIADCTGYCDFVKRFWGDYGDNQII